MKRYRLCFIGFGNVGRALVRVGLGRLPEETAPPAELRALALPALELSSPSLQHAP